MRHMADLEETLRPFVDSGDVPGLVALVARGEDVAVVTLGTRDSTGVPMARDSLFRGASITKPVTAALTMALVEDGRIDLDAPVADLLPELAEPRVLRTLESPLDDTVACQRPITARHLLTGTAGHGFCTWESAVTPLLMERLRLKQARLARLALQYLGARGRHDATCRFDVIAVTLRPPDAPRVEHFEDAFRLD